MPARKFSVGKDELQDFQLEEWKVVPQNPIAPDGRVMKYRENHGMLGSVLILVRLQGKSRKESGERQDVRNFELQLPGGPVGGCSVMKSVGDPALNVILQNFSSR